MQNSQSIYEKYELIVAKCSVRKRSNMIYIHVLKRNTNNVRSPHDIRNIQEYLRSNTGTSKAKNKWIKSAFGYVNLLHLLFKLFDNGMRTNPANC